ncbi:hypothetical protein BpHYR1_049839 [Brachionus plicatilis]|uniref:Uncharacterized protein n=1 Tax=Brachionus plicatilis TaxID=10195 RepID=A0A3M7PHM2_BRAPC|nr:hypothetical protein BpHYR1_049839 [Brachionus plicatilis]
MNISQKFFYNCKFFRVEKLLRNNDLSCLTLQKNKLIIKFGQIDKIFFVRQTQQQPKFGSHENSWWNNMFRDRELSS